MTTDITAIVPTYNRASLLPETIQSIVNQNRPVKEIIVWDDGSTDPTAEVVAKLCNDLTSGEHPPLRYFKSENGGKSRALNLALEQTDSAYVWICDDDDVGMPNATEIMAKMLDEDPSLVAAGGSYKRFSIDPSTKERTEQGPGYWPDLNSGSTLRHLLEDIFLFQNATLVRKSAFDAVGPFREDLARSIDYDMVIRLACAGPIRIVEDTVFLQRKHDGDRGPAAARHAAAKSEAAWKLADQDVFAPFREQIPLSLYESMFESDNPALVQRAALLQRACVYARRTDWDTALKDFAAAERALPDCALTQVEVGICRRALAGKHGCVEVLNRKVQQNLRQLAKRSAAGAGIGKALARGAVWRLREAMHEKKLGDALAIAAFISLLASFAGTTKSGRLPVELAERAILPLSAYKMIKVASTD